MLSGNTNQSLDKKKGSDLVIGYTVPGSSAGIRSYHTQFLKRPVQINPSRHDSVRCLRCSGGEGESKKQNTSDKLRITMRIQHPQAGTYHNFGKLP